MEGEGKKFVKVGTRQTFLTDDSRARHVNHVVERVEEGEDRSVACLLSESSDEPRIRGLFAELCTVNDECFPADMFRKCGQVGSRID
jgi:hypothetical protein